MGLTSSFGKLRALPSQFIEIPDGVVLKRGCTEIKIAGDGACEAVRLLYKVTGGLGATLEEICSRFKPAEQDIVEELITQLLARRLLIPEETSDVLTQEPETSLDVFYWNFGRQAAEISNSINAQRIVVLGVNCVSRQLVSALCASEIDNFAVIDIPLMRNLRLFDDTAQLRKDKWPSLGKWPIEFEEWAEKTDIASVNCVVATSDFGGHRMLRDWNRYCVEHRRHYLPVILRDCIGQIGPFVVPGETACFECLHLRQNSHNHQSHDRIAADENAFQGQPFTGFHPSMASILGDLAAVELTKFYSGVLPTNGIGCLIEINLLATHLISRKVLKVPRCPVCSHLKTRSSATPQKRIFGTLSSNGPTPA